MKKALVVCHVGRHMRLFGHADIRVLQSMGYEVHFASNFSLDIDKAEDHSVVLHQVDFSRSPLSLKNLTALIQMIKLLKKENYSLMHCQSPTGSVVSRIAARIVGFKPVIYMAHGLPFYNDVHNLQNSIIRLIERVCARWTDYIITINQEDYETALKFKLRKGGQVFKTHGVGIDLNRFNICNEEQKIRLRFKFGIDQNAFVFICVGELSKRKNQEQIIRAFKKYYETVNNSMLLIVGTGDLADKYEELTKELKISDNVWLTGYRRDIADLLCVSDVAISASKSEGLPVNVMEAMSTGIPTIVTNCRGNVDLIEDGKTGLVVSVDNVKEMTEAMLRIYNNSNLADQMRKAGLQKVKSFDIKIAQLDMRNCFEIVMGTIE